MTVNPPVLKRKVAGVKLSKYNFLLKILSAINKSMHVIIKMHNLSLASSRSA